MSDGTTSIAIPQIDGVELTFEPPSTLRLRGALARRDPSKDLGGYFRALHEDAIARALPELVVDVRELTFVNSSSIRLFIDWSAWVSGEKRHRYLLRFLTTPKVAWQVTTFAALASLMGTAIAVERA